MFIQQYKAHDRQSGHNLRGRAYSCLEVFIRSIIILVWIQNPFSFLTNTVLILMCLNFQSRHLIVLLIRFIKTSTTNEAVFVPVLTQRLSEFVDGCLFNYMNINLKRLSSLSGYDLNVSIFPYYTAGLDYLRRVRSTAYSAQLLGVCLRRRAQHLLDSLENIEGVYKQNVFCCNIVPVLCRSSHLCRIHHCLSQSLQQSTAGLQSQVSAPARTQMATDAVIVTQH